MKSLPLPGTHSLANRLVGRLNWFALVLAIMAGPRLPAAEARLDLTGSWAFAMDALDRGEQLGWPKPDGGWKGDKPHQAEGWDAVTVPHDFLSDPRYVYTGVAWFRRSFAVPAGAQPGWVWRLQFDQVSQRCRVWLNGELVGSHEGGYTPFNLDVTAQVRPGPQNFLVVAVDNRIQPLALPGGRSGNQPTAQLFPWLNYGGILGRVALEARAAVYIVRQQIEARPAGTSDGGVFTSHVTVRNASAEARVAQVSVMVGEEIQVVQEVTLAPHSEQRVTLGAPLPATWRRWTLEEQPLYMARAAVRSRDSADQVEDSFGVRTIVAKGGQLLLNGQPVHLAGANRARGHGRFGGLDPDEAVQEDMQLMKAAGLRLARLQHTPPQRNLLDWADRNGMLLILEVGVWGFKGADLGSPELQRQFKGEMTELVAMAANHPSVIGWSVGNEYESWSPEGLAWTRDMTAFVKQLDPTRPVTFAALGTALRKLREDTGPAVPHAFDFVDFISTNIYFKPDEVPAYLDPVNARWPDKPVLISEFGLRSDRVKDEQERLVHFDQMLALVRARPWICGLSFWSFNDYASHYPGSGADGYRRWGLVDEFRRPRALYEHVRVRVGRGLNE